MEDSQPYRWRRKSLPALDYSLGSSSPVQPSTPSDRSPARFTHHTGSSSPSAHTYSFLTDSGHKYCIIGDKRRRANSISSTEDEEDLLPATSDFEVDMSSSVFDAEEDEDEAPLRHPAFMTESLRPSIRHAESSERGLWATMPPPKLSPGHPKPVTLRRTTAISHPLLSVKRTRTAPPSPHPPPAPAQSDVISEIASIDVFELPAQSDILDIPIDAAETREGTPFLPAEEIEQVACIPVQLEPTKESVKVPLSPLRTISQNQPSSSKEKSQISAQVQDKSKPNVDRRQENVSQGVDRSKKRRKIEKTRRDTKNVEVPLKTRSDDDRGAPKPDSERKSKAVTKSRTGKDSILDSTSLTELHGLLIEHLALARASSLPTSALAISVKNANPALVSSILRDKGLEWQAIVETVLQEGWQEGKGFYGRVIVEVRANDPSQASSGEEEQWFYLPEQDSDRDRADLIRSMMPRAAGKRKETMKYKQYYWKPLGKVSRWEGDDVL